MIDRNRVVSIPLVVDINTEATGDIKSRGAYIRNGHVDAYFDKRAYVTQRPSIVIEEDASSFALPQIGRGIFYWNTTDALYFVNYNKVYKTSYSNALGTLSAGRDKVHFALLNDKMILVDSQNNKGWLIDTVDNFSAITDTDFPTTLAAGVVSMDGFGFVMDKQGSIYQSALGDLVNWNALDFIEAEREPDGGVFITKHHNCIVAAGTRTIEFFYNAANPVGSVLSRRNDVFYSVGGFGGSAFANHSDTIFFIGANETGNIGAFTIQDFKLNKVSTNIIDSYLTKEAVNNDSEILCASQEINGKHFYFVTLCAKEGERFSPITTLVYDFNAALWYIWDTTILGHNDFAIMDTSVRTTRTPRYGEGIFVNGDLYRPRYVDIPQDTNRVTSPYVEQGYMDDNYVSSGGTEELQSSIALEIVTHPVDTGGRFYKFMRSVELLGNLGDAQGDIITIGISDDYYTHYHLYTLPTEGRRKLSRLGRYSRREFKVSYSGSELLRAEKLEAIVDNGEF